MPITGAVIVPHPPIILPEIGHGEQIRIQKTIDAYQEAAKQVVDFHPETLIIISPHTTMYRDYFHLSPGVRAEGDFTAFGAPQVKLRAVYDSTMVHEIEQCAAKMGIMAGTDGERDKSLDHATMIPLWFIKQAYARQGRDMECLVVRLGLSGMSYEEHFRMGQCIRRVLEASGKRTVIVASADLSHRLLDSGPYEFAPQGPDYDQRITAVMAEGALHKALLFEEDFCEKAGECGHRSIAILAGSLEGISLKAKLLSYEGPFGVGYAVAVYQDAYVALARESLEYYLKSGTGLKPPDWLPEKIKSERAGVFVSLKKQGGLRGCIGTIQGVCENVAKELIENAVSAGIWDPRFPQVQLSELPDIVCTVDVLSQAQCIESKEELDVKKYGVIVSQGKKRGLLLPNLEGVSTVEEQINIALSKAGIEEGDYCLERFEVVRHY